MLLNNLFNNKKVLKVSNYVFLLLLKYIKKNGITIKLLFLLINLKFKYLNKIYLDNNNILINDIINIISDSNIFINIKINNIIIYNVY